MRYLAMEQRRPGRARAVGALGSAGRPRGSRPGKALRESARRGADAETVRSTRKRHDQERLQSVHSRPPRARGEARQHGQLPPAVRRTARRTGTARGRAVQRRHHAYRHVASGVPRPSAHAAGFPRGAGGELRYRTDSLRQVPHREAGLEDPYRRRDHRIRC